MIPALVPSQASSVICMRDEAVVPCSLVHSQGPRHIMLQVVMCVSSDTWWVSLAGGARLLVPSFVSLAHSFDWHNRTVTKRRDGRHNRWKFTTVLVVSMYHRLQRTWLAAWRLPGPPALAGALACVWLRCSRCCIPKGS